MGNLAGAAGRPFNRLELCLEQIILKFEGKAVLVAVSYTHLDVYKRQAVFTELILKQQRIPSQRKEQLAIVAHQIQKMLLPMLHRISEMCIRDRFYVKGEMK